MNTGVSAISIIEGVHNILFILNMYLEQIIYRTCIQIKLRRLEYIVIGTYIKLILDE